MKNTDKRSLRRTVILPLAAVLMVVMGAACRPPESAGYQGYFEGEYVHVAPALSGRLELLAVARGERVEAGALLFGLEAEAEIAARDEAASRLTQAGARLSDLRKGRRPSEIAALEARLAQARAAAELSAIDLDRTRQLLAARAVAADDMDRARLSDERNRRTLDELTAEIETARLGARDDAILAAEAEVAASQAALQRAEWAVGQKRVVATEAALVFDTLRREGEFVPAGTPVLTLLPPGNLKVRFFVPEADVSAIRPGRTVFVTHTGRDEALTGRVTYVSPRAEFTPPVLYNRDNREKLVFMIEAVFPPEVAAGLHPGQPVDVILSSGE